MYRNWADRETYGEVQERNLDPRWKVDRLLTHRRPHRRSQIASTPAYRGPPRAARRMDFFEFF